MSYSILVVDDDETIREAFTDILEDEGYIVHTASTPSEAIKYFELNKYDVIYIDIILPEKSGIELARDFRSQEYDSSIIMFTGTPKIDDLKESLHLSIFDFLTKPINSDKLIATTKYAIEKSIKRKCYSNKIKLIDECGELQETIFDKQNQLDNMILGGQFGDISLQNMVAALASERQETRARLSIINSQMKKSIQNL